MQVVKQADGGLLLVDAISKQVNRHEAQMFVHPDSKMINNSDGSFKLSDGHVFVDASTPLVIETDDTRVHLKKGAMASVVAQDKRTFVRVCSKSGTVFAEVDGQLIHLNSGEELLVSDKKLSLSEIASLDHIARRNSHVSTAGQKTLAVSDFSILSMISNHDTLRKLHKSDRIEDRHLLFKLLKIAASVDLVLKNRGAYSE